MRRTGKSAIAAGANDHADYAWHLDMKKQIFQFGLMFRRMKERERQWSLISPAEFKEFRFDHDGIRRRPMRARDARRECLTYDIREMSPLSRK